MSTDGDDNSSYFDYFKIKDTNVDQMTEAMVKKMAQMCLNKAKIATDITDEILKDRKWKMIFNCGLFNLEIQDGKKKS